MAFKAVPITHNPGATHTDFPVIVKPSAIIGWTTLTSTEADSIRFYSDIGKTTELARHVVAADRIYVKLPSFNAPTTIYADYDGVRPDYAITDTFGRNSTWSGNFSAVWIPELDGVDATGNGNDLSRLGDANNLGVGQFGAAFTFDGVGDAYSAATFASHASRNVYTISGWVFLNTLGASDVDDSALFTYAGSPSNADLLWYNYTAVTTGDNKYTWNCYRAQDAPNRVNGATSPSAGAWSHVAGSRNTTLRTLYVDGLSDGTSTGSDIVNAASTEVQLGGWSRSSNFTMDGRIDEVRVSTLERLAAWVASEHANADFTTFYGTVTDVSANRAKSIAGISNV